MLQPDGPEQSNDLRSMRQMRAARPEEARIARRWRAKNVPAGPAPMTPISASAESGERFSSIRLARKLMKFPRVFSGGVSVTGRADLGEETAGGVAEICRRGA